MGIHMDLDYHEPPQGDFVRLIDAMVGAPPQDPEATAKEISAQLEARSKKNRELVEQVGQRSENAAPASWNRGTTGNTVAGGPPDVAEALESLARTGIRGIASTVGGLLILAGIAVFVLSVAMPGILPSAEPALGVGLFFVGVVVRNAFS